MMANGKTERSKEVGCGKDQKAFHMLENGILTLSKALEFYLKKTQDTKGNSKITWNLVMEPFVFRITRFTSDNSSKIYYQGMGTTIGQMVIIIMDNFWMGKDMAKDF